ncbi:hypothetical protein CFOL_v3_25334, partial [Cephalotus follicularis]
LLLQPTKGPHFYTKYNQMGCCFSSTERDPCHQKASNQHHSPPKSHANSHPLPQLEVETVKEVLSETSISKPHHQNTPKIPTTTGTVQEEKQETTEVQEEISEISQTSEISCLNESVSTTTATTTTTTTTIREDEATSKRSRDVSHRVDGPRKRPYSGDLGSFGDNVRGRRPKSTPRNVGSTRVRKDFRSAGGDVGRGGRGGSRVKITGKAGSRSVGGGDVEGGSEEEKKVGEGFLKQKGNTNESVENPLVTLECFIFL